METFKVRTISTTFIRAENGDDAIKEALKANPDFQGDIYGGSIRSRPNEHQIIFDDQLSDYDGLCPHCRKYSGTLYVPHPNGGHSMVVFCADHKVFWIPASCSSNLSSEEIAEMEPLRKEVE